MQEFHGRVHGIKVQAVDTTGAGDAFVSGLLNNLAADPDLYKVNSTYYFLYLAW